MLKYLIFEKKIIIFIFLFILIQPTSAQKAPQEIHCKHFFYGYPLGTPESNDLIIRDIYALSSNDSRKFADWVAYRLDKSTITGASVDERNWKADPWLDDSETLEPQDYKNAYEKLGVDRGHQAPLASFKGTTSAEETNYLSNITPQKSELNRGVWKSLEDIERKLVDTFGLLYVMTGPIYERSMSQLPNADEPHTVPSGYWKIIVIPGKRNTFNVAAFLFNQDTQGNTKLINCLVSVDEVEKRSGLNFFWELDAKTEEKIESKIDKGWLEKYFK